MGSSFGTNGLNLSVGMQATSKDRPDEGVEGEHNYAFARIPYDGTKMLISLNWKNNKINLTREKSEEIRITIARLKRTLAKITDRSRGVKRKAKSVAESTSTNDFSISFLTNVFKTFDENTTCEDTIKGSSFISINDTLLQLFTNITQLKRVEIADFTMLGCPVPIIVKDEDDNIVENITVEWIDSNGKVFGTGLIYTPTQSILGFKIKARVINRNMKYNILESDYTEIVAPPSCRWQISRIQQFNATFKEKVNGLLQSDTDDLRVMSFNILSPTYISSSDAISRFFPYCPLEYLDYNYRTQLILREILNLSPKILCTQECSSRVYREYLKPSLSNNYDSWLTLKTGNSDEGCATFIHKDFLFNLEHLDLSFKEVIKSDEYKFIRDNVAQNWLLFDDRYFDRYHTIYQFGCFRKRNDDSKFVFLANTHLYFHPMGRHIRLLQAYVLLREMEKFKKKMSLKYSFDIEKDSFTLICGDFNSFPGETVYKFMTNGFIPYNHQDWKFGSFYLHLLSKHSLGEIFGYDRTNLSVAESYRKPSEDYTKDLDIESIRNSHEYLFVEDYQGYSEAYIGRELLFTNFVQTFKGTLDYIYHSKNIKVKRVLPGITSEEAQEHTGLPSKLYPSDHLSIAADF
ncbi:endonuclease/exonuclease/phosphatase family member protein [Theileria equi strain WA]|uniref:Endonuclease/exonuclease/phosphatase family member protein n=1 Tax=Theileria equi strain WA TaxID=1537102 RepID=L0AU26_THEEQ|nr:endonuclease/exonuclease/phosphatase family member protein [Theileria equi strain WA]AFZ79147.1 endonuclease/exonuclease/phosphatase family member protein [Theileria equi strain WA]|eukprot:XP_004828813.1 endonuclease/exonuclease/phosphatase family member protein [Theileria equi strain WA]